MLEILPKNIKNPENIDEYEVLTSNKEDIDKTYNSKINIADADNYELLMSMYVAQFTDAILNKNINNKVEVNLSDIDLLSNIDLLV